MKKISILFLLAANAFFLTGCWKRKQVNTTENTAPIQIDGNTISYSNPEISFIENNPDYVLTPGKTIFDDSTPDSAPINDTIIYSEEIMLPENNNCLNNFIIQEEINNSQISNPMIIEKTRSHLSTVLFDFDKSESIRPEYETILQGAIAQIQLALEKNPNASVIIEGHACNSCGSERYNLELSNQRALTIKNKIISKTNINPEKLSVFGCGTSHLIVHGGRYEQGPNRRVEIFTINN